MNDAEDLAHWTSLVLSKEASWIERKLALTLLRMWVVKTEKKLKEESQNGQVEF